MKNAHSLTSACIALTPLFWLVLLARRFARLAMSVAPTPDDVTRKVRDSSRSTRNRVGVPGAAGPMTRFWTGKRRNFRVQTADGP